MGTFPHRGPVKYHGESVHRELLRDSSKGALETGHLSLSTGALLGEPGGGLLC